MYVNELRNYAKELIFFFLLIREIFFFSSIILLSLLYLKLFSQLDHASVNHLKTFKHNN